MNLAVLVVWEGYATLWLVVVVVASSEMSQTTWSSWSWLGKEPRHRSREAADVDKWGDCLALWSSCLLTDAADKFIAAPS